MTQMKKLSPLRAKNDVTHPNQLKLHERINKKQILTSYGCNKNLDDEIKKNKRRRLLIAPTIAVRLLKIVMDMKEDIRKR